MDYGYLLEPPRRNMKIPEFFVWKFSFFGGKILNIFEQACFLNEWFHILVSQNKFSVHYATGESLDPLAHQHNLGRIVIFRLKAPWSCLLSVDKKKKKNKKKKTKKKKKKKKTKTQMASVDAPTFCNP